MTEPTRRYEIRSVPGPDGKPRPGVIDWVDISHELEQPAPKPEPEPPTNEPPVPPDPQPDPDDRPVIRVGGNLGKVVYRTPNQIIDFGGFNSPDVTILADNVEVRHLYGGGARRIGGDGVDVHDSGFYDFHFTFAHFRTKRGSKTVDCYFKLGYDVNALPHVGDGDIIQCFGYDGGEIIRPLLEDITAYGKQKPSGSKAHNDTCQFSEIAGGVVRSPTIRRCRFEGASSAAIQIKGVADSFTIEDCVLSERFGSYHAVIAKATVNDVVLLWRNNDLQGGSAAFDDEGGRWVLHPDSEDVL